MAEQGPCPRDSGVAIRPCKLGMSARERLRHDLVVDPFLITHPHHTDCPRIDSRFEINVRCLMALEDIWYPTEAGHHQSRRWVALSGTQQGRRADHVLVCDCPLVTARRSSRIAYERLASGTTFRLSQKASCESRPIHPPRQVQNISKSSGT
jgi:hypothetical protein